MKGQTNLFRDLSESGRVLVMDGKFVSDLPNGISSRKAKYTIELMDPKPKSNIYHRQDYRMLGLLRKAPASLLVTGPLLKKHVTALDESVLEIFGSTVTRRPVVVEIDPCVIRDNGMIQQAIDCGCTLVLGDSFEILRYAWEYRPHLSYLELDLSSSPRAMRAGLDMAIFENEHFRVPKELAIHMSCDRRATENGTYEWGGLKIALDSLFNNHHMAKYENSGPQKESSSMVTCMQVFRQAMFCSPEKPPVCDKYGFEGLAMGTVYQYRFALNVVGSHPQRKEIFKGLTLGKSAREISSSISHPIRRSCLSSAMIAMRRLGIMTGSKRTGIAINESLIDSRRF